MLALEITSYRSVSSQTSCHGNRNILKTFTGIRRVMFYWFATTKWTLPVSSFLPRENTIFRGKKSETRKRLSYICSRLKSQKTLSVDNCLWGQALSSFSISKSLIITCDLHTAYSTVHFRNHHPLWLFHLIIFYSSLSLPLSKLQKGLILQPLENRPSGVFPTSHFRTSYLCFSLVSREVVMTTCRFQRLSCELNLQRSFFRSSSNEPVNR